MLESVLGGLYTQINQKDVEDGIVNNTIKGITEKPLLKGGDPSAPFLFFALKPEEILE